MKFLQAQSKTHIFLAVYALFLALLFGLHPIDSFDQWWHIQSGKWSVAQGEFPQADPFSYTFNGASWTHHEWGSSVLLYIFFAFLGIPGLFAFKIILLFYLFYFVGRTIQTKTKSNALPVLSLFLFSFLSFHRFFIRPHLFTLFFLAGLLFFLSNPFEKKRVWQIPVCFLLWANLHAGALLGLGLFGIYTLAEFILKKQTVNSGLKIVTFILSALALLLNPYTTAVYTFPFEHLNLSHYMMRVEEWQSPFIWLQLFSVQGFLLLAAATIVIIFLRRKSLQWAYALLSLPLLYLSLKHVRYTALFCLWAIPFLAEQIKDFKIVALCKKAQFQFTAISLIILFIFFGIPIDTNGNTKKLGVGVLPHVAPTQAVEFLYRNTPAKGDAKTSYTARQQMKVFHDLSFASYLIFSGVPVFIDSRNPIYPEVFFQEYQKALVNPNAFEALDQKWRFRFVMLAKAKQEQTKALRNYLAANSEWKLRYEDTVSTIYRKEEDPRP